VRDIGAEGLGRLQVPLWTGCGRKTEDCRRVQDHRETVRHQRMVRHVPGRAIGPDVAGDRIGHRVRQVDARVAKTDASIRRREQHVCASLIV
jgi:hypothetical protein